MFLLLTAAACVLCRTRTGSEGGQKGPAWVVGVEDFMRRFLPGRSNAKSIFALAQLNGIVKYACQKVRSITSTTVHHCCTMLSITHVLLFAFRFDDCEISCTKDRFELCVVLSLALRALQYLLKKEEDLFAISRVPSYQCYHSAVVLLSAVGHTQQNRDDITLV